MNSSQLIVFIQYFFSLYFILKFHHWYSRNYFIKGFNLENYFSLRFVMEMGLARTGFARCLLKLGDLTITLQIFNLKLYYFYFTEYFQCWSFKSNDHYRQFHFLYLLINQLLFIYFRFDFYFYMINLMKIFIFIINFIQKKYFELIKVLIIDFIFLNFKFYQNLLF